MRIPLKKKLLCLLVALCCGMISCVSGAEDDQEGEWGRLIRSKPRETIDRMKDVFPPNLDGKSPYDGAASITQGCQRDLLATIEAAANEDAVGEENDDNWALLALDASGQVGPGVFDGNDQYLGNVQECHRVKASNKEYSILVGGKTVQHKHTSDGKYCRVYWTLENNNMASKGVCVPETCSEKDIRYIYKLGKDTTALPVNRVFCEEPLEYGKDISAIVGTVILTIFAVVILVSTIIDLVLWCKQMIKCREESTTCNGGAVTSNGDIAMAENPQVATDDANAGEIPNKKGTAGKIPKALQLLLCFSLKKNLPPLLSTEDQSRIYSSLNGLRFLAMVWILYGHSYQLGNYVMSSNFLYVLGNRQYVYNQLINSKAFVNSIDLGVEIFFVLSGCLVTLSLLKTLEKGKGKMTWGQVMYYFLHRWLRITPVYMFIIMLYACFFPYLGDTPQPRQEMEYQFCRENWWVNLLYLQNVFRAEQACMGWSWYVANDIWYHFFAPLPVYLLYRFRKCGIAFMVIWIILHLAIRTTIAVLGGGFYDLYIPPWTRSGPFATGILTGYIIYTIKGKLRLHMGVQVALWVVCGVLFQSLIQWGHNIPMYPVYRGDIMSWIICWLVIACTSCSAGWINAALSWKLMIPLSRLTYVGYLIHPILIYYHAEFSTRPFHMENSIMVFFTCGVLLVTIMLSVVLTLMFEIPFMEMERILMPKPNPPPAVEDAARDN